MYKKGTDELEKVLKRTHPDEIGAYIRENEAELLPDDRPFMKYMKQKLKEKGLKEQEVLVRADIALGYGYKLFREEKVTRQRDVILRICYASELTVAETQQVLEICRMGRLYARDPRDALLMTCFNRRPGTIIDINELLTRNRLPVLRPSGVQE